MALQSDSNIIWEASQISPNLDGERLGRTQQHKFYSQLQGGFHIFAFQRFAAEVYCGKMPISRYEN